MGNMSGITPTFHLLREKIGWRKTVYLYKKLESKLTHSSTSDSPRPLSIASALSSYKSDKPHDNVPKCSKNTPVSSSKNIAPPQAGLTKDKAGERGDDHRHDHVPNPQVSKLIAQIQADLKKKDTSRFADRTPGARLGLALQDQEPIQSIAPTGTDVKLNSENSGSILPWIPEKVLFTRAAMADFPLGFINRGAFGSVFLVRHRDQHDLAALKVVQIQKGLSDTLVGEIHALTRIRNACNRFVLRQPVGVGEVMWTSDSGHLHLLFVRAHIAIPFRCV
jgi:hypothetical protein